MSKKKNYCQRCNFDTNHNVLKKESLRSDNEDYDYIIEYMIVQCLGCERISFRKEFIDIESAYPNEFGDWIPDVSVDNYPKRLKIQRTLENTYILPDKIKFVYEESIRALNADCLLLTGVAFRAVIEAICIENKIPGRDLQKKINNLVKKKLITEKEAHRLHSIRFLGNDSVHEMKIPKEESLKIVLNIIEHLLNNLYLIDHNSGQHLETVISKFNQLTDLLDYRLSSFSKDDEIPLAAILGKNVRRLNGQLIDFEKKLIDKINKGEYNLLSIGKKEKFGNSQNEVQHFVIK